jgi:tetratricopeptide (TPR) repeat protein
MSRKIGKFENVIEAITGGLRSAFDFCIFWLLTLPWMKIALSIPFWLALFFIGVLWSDRNDRVREDRYLTQRLSDALRAEDYDSAKLLIDRKLKNNPGDEDAQYERALIMASNQETEAATRMMFQLATGDIRGADFATKPDSPEGVVNALETLSRVKFGGGNARAGLWLLSQHFAPKMANGLTEIDAAFLDGMLPWLNEKYPKDVSLANLYADRLVALKMNAAALPVIERIADQSPELRLKAAILARSIGQEQTADGYAEQALSTLKQNSSTAPDAFAMRMTEAGCLVFLDRHQEAIDVLGVAGGLAKTDAQQDAVRTKAAQVWVVWSAKMLEKGGLEDLDHQRVLANLQQAVKIAPQDPMVLTFLMNYLLATAKDDDQENAEIKESLLVSTSPGVAHFVRGTAASIRGNIDEAAFHLEMASKDLPNSDVILNNLAYMLAFQQKPDLPRALQLAELAIARQTNPAPHFLDTRGHIRRKMGNWLEAIPDLEQGTKVPDLAVAAHEALADCYRQLGKEAQGASHQAVAEKLKAKL